MPTDPKTQHELFVAGVTLLGGPRTAARALETSDRTIHRLISGDAELHDGFLRDMANAMHLHALACRELEKRLNPLFSANLVPGQAREDRRRTGARHRDPSDFDPFPANSTERSASDVAFGPRDEEPG